MVQMMESQCEYYMYFPAVPITDLSDPARYRTLPRRSHLYLGETVRFLLVLRCRDGAATPTDRSPGKEGLGWGGEGGAPRTQTRPGLYLLLRALCNGYINTGENCCLILYNTKIFTRGDKGQCNEYKLTLHL